MIYLYLWIYLYLHEKPFTISLIVIESTAEIFWQGLCAKPTENFLIKSCHGPMVRNPQKNTSNVALSTALWPGNRQGINSKHKAGTSQKPCCKSHNPDIPAVALLFHLDVASHCQKPHTSWAFYGFLGNIFRIFFHHFSTMLFFPPIFGPPGDRYGQAWYHVSTGDTGTGEIPEGQLFNSMWVSQKLPCPSSCHIWSSVR